MIPQCGPQTPSTRFTSTILSPVLPTRASLAETTYYSQIQSLKMITGKGATTRQDFSDEPCTI